MAGRCGTQPLVARFGRLTAIIGVLALATACHGDTKRARDIQRRTARAGATMSDLTGPDRVPGGVQFRWEVRSHQSWADYRAGVIDELRRDFTVVRSDTSSLLLSRSEGADVYR